MPVKKKTSKKATPKAAKKKASKKKAVKKAKKKTIGRPKRAFTDAQKRKMKELALAGCQNNTIANIMDIPIETLTRRFGKLLTKKRCERKYNIRKAQNKHMKTTPIMSIFLGKNELNQADKTENHDTLDIKVNIVSYADLPDDPK